jgi:hypothetical protein
MRRARKSAGQTLLLVSVSSSVLFGLLALVVDVGWAYYRQQAAQAAADAAVLAAAQAAATSAPVSIVCGSNQVWCGSPAGTATACPATAPTTMTTNYDNACAMAAQNGFVTSGKQRVTIQANTTSSAPTAPGATVSYWVVARVSEVPLSFFGHLIGPGLNAVASATAGLVPTHGGGCIYVLDPKAQDAFTAGNDGTISANCGIYVNSNGTSADPPAEAMLVTQGSTVSVTNAAVNVDGSVLTSQGGSTSGTVNQNTGTTVADPLASLPTPTVGSCLPASAGQMGTYQSTPYTPSAGTYCSGFSLSNGNSAVMGAGTYIINGGQFSIQSGPLTATGPVMIFLTNGATAQIANGTSVTLSAMTTGPYAGVLFYSDRAYTPGGSTVAGGATMTLSGSLYFPTSLLTFNNGDSTSGTKMAIVADELNFQGGAKLLVADSTSDTGINPSQFSVVTIQ